MYIFEDRLNWNTMQMSFKGTQWHVLIYQKSLISISTISNKIEQIMVFEKTQHQDFNKKLLVSLHSISVQLLHSHNLFKNVPKTQTLVQQIQIDIGFVRLLALGTFRAVAFRGPNASHQCCVWATKAAFVS